MEPLAEVPPEGSAEEPAFIEPTIRSRIPVYDFLRGVAILGILPANLPWFGLPFFAEPHAGTGAASDAFVDALTLALATGKFRSLLAMLFGIGLWLQFRKRRAVPGNWPGGYWKRTLILAGIGAVHGFLIWHGDILLLYAAVAMAACLLAGSDDGVRRFVVAATAVLALGLGLALLASGVLAGGDDAGRTVAGITRASELATFAQGSYFAQLRMRSQMFVSFILQWVIIVPLLLGQFIVGVQLAKHRILEAPRMFPAISRWFLFVGIGIGLPLNLAAGWLDFRRRSEEIEASVEVLLGPLLALGLIMLLAIISETGRWPQLQKAIANVGRLALTSYLLQSILCTFLFYSWGLGYFGRLNRLELLAVGTGVGAFNLAFAAIWLRGFVLGPAEWVWRSLAEGRRMPMRKGDLA